MEQLVEAGKKWLQSCFNEQWVQAFESNMQFQKEICWQSEESTKDLQAQNVVEYENLETQS
jgi:hypothetical protein